MHQDCITVLNKPKYPIIFQWPIIKNSWTLILKNHFTPMSRGIDQKKDHSLPKNNFNLSHKPFLPVEITLNKSSPFSITLTFTCIYVWSGTLDWGIRWGFTSLAKLDELWKKEKRKIYWFIMQSRYLKWVWTQKT